jgi:hypothetical protein
VHRRRRRGGGGGNREQFLVSAVITVGLATVNVDVIMCGMTASIPVLPVKSQLRINILFDRE